jgi:hypothetical protein
MDREQNPQGLGMHVRVGLHISNQTIYLRDDEIARWMRGTLIV